MKDRILAKGFTLLELLIVIAIIAILSVVLIVALNPAETLRKTRDSQRISDLASLKTALGIYVTTTTDPQLDNTSGNTLCVGGSGSDSIWVSVPTAIETITDLGPYGGMLTAVQRASNTTASAIDGTGWVPVNIGGITGGSPISN
ncbi:MAG: prepilin-type N-terminal cleavage/methylation domain-containing protein, partial [Candidatus Colwellbacteria bacterium]|nr:prepilin-type N-terminal cleavage/methylation domain-containing protein [Candidatus Colwellbacteria bacterium]